MKILQVVPTYIPAWRYGGTIVSVHGLCRALASRGHQVEVFTTNADGRRTSDVPTGKQVEIEGVVVTYFDVSHPRRIFRSTDMKRALENRMGEFDLLHTHSVFLWPPAAAARTAVSRNVPYVLSPRGMLVPELIEAKSAFAKRTWISLIERRNLAAAAGIHFTSEREYEDAARLGVSLPHPFVVPNGVQMFPEPVDDRDPWKVLFLGRVNWKKGIDRLLRALALLPSAMLVVAGNDEESYTARLRAIAVEEGVADRVTFAGRVEAEEKLRLLRSASVVVLPSMSENFGNVVLEAMAAGRPVVVTPEVGAAAIVSREECGIVSDGCPPALASAIERLLANPEIARKMGRRGHAAARNYSWDSVSNRMEIEYTRIISSRARNARHA